MIAYVPTIPTIPTIPKKTPEAHKATLYRCLLPPLVHPVRLQSPRVPSHSRCPSSIDSPQDLNGPRMLINDGIDGGAPDKKLRLGPVSLSRLMCRTSQAESVAKLHLILAASIAHDQPSLQESRGVSPQDLALNHIKKPNIRASPAWLFWEYSNSLYSRVGEEYNMTIWYKKRTKTY